MVKELFPPQVFIALVLLLGIPPAHCLLAGRRSLESSKVCVGEEHSVLME